MKIAVDFDGTIVENKYPSIGKPMLFAFDTLKALQKKGHYLILWTYREGERLEDAVAFCKEHGVEFYAVNHSYPEESMEYKHFYNKISRKIDADMFIDDRNVGGFVGWSKVWQMMYPAADKLDLQYVNKEAHDNYKKWSFFSKIFGK